MKICGIIFDLDGVLADTEPIHFEAHKKALEHFGIIVTMDDYMRFGLGVGDEEFYRSASLKYDVPVDDEEVTVLKRILYREIFSEKVSPNPEVIGMMESLREEFRLALASSGSRESVDFMLEKLGLDEFFRIRVTGDDVARVKPYPDIYEAAVKRLGLEIDECIAVEDSQTGLRSAKVAGMKCIAIPNGFTESQDFSEADLVLKSLSGITFEKIGKLGL